MAPDETFYGEAGRGGSTGIKDLYILVNNKIDPTFDVVPDATLQVGARSLATILKREGRNNVASAYTYAQRNRIAFHLAFLDATIPDLPPERAQEEFSQGYMTYLFGLGEARAKTAQPWDATPPLSHAPLAAPTAPSTAAVQSPAATLATTAATGG